MNESNLLLELILKGQFGPGKEFFTSLSDGTVRVSLFEMLKAGYPQLVLSVLSNDKLDGFFFPHADKLEAFKLAVEQKQENVALEIFIKLSPSFGYGEHSTVSYAIKYGCNCFLLKYVESVTQTHSENRKIAHINRTGPGEASLLQCAVIYKNLEAIEILKNCYTKNTGADQFLSLDKNGRSSLGVAALMTVANPENKHILLSLLEIVKTWKQWERWEAFNRILCQMDNYKHYGEKDDESDFLRKESGLAEEKYPDGSYENVKNIIHEVLRKVDEKEQREAVWENSLRAAEERKYREKKEAERQAKLEKEMEEFKREAWASVNETFHFGHYPDDDYVLDDMADYARTLRSM